MDVEEFQKKLSEICAVAAANNKTLTTAQVRDFFAGSELETEQLVKVLQYLKTQGITIEGAEIPSGSSAEQKEQEKPKGKRVPLTSEEEAYLRSYRSGLSQEGLTDDPEEVLFQRLARGDALAREELTRRYLFVAAETAAELNCEEIFLADLIQEATVGLLTALEQQEPLQKSDFWLRGEIRRGILRAIEEQTQQKFQDDCLVAKVEKLESAVRELTGDEEDNEPQFSIGELAVILDMDVEEIKDILRLTGDDK
ncbi:MAG: hypothetical protein Q4C91_12290 [Eubacteriales bacterium]|nr:hypothetical protein [Eubacteriales bacterium]